MSQRITVTDLQKKKAEGRRLTMLTAYDALLARALEAAGVDIILVGDSLGEVVQGHDSTLPVTMEAAAYHTEIVVRCTERAMVVADMPFMSYTVSPEEACRNAGRLIQQAGAGAVKLEGGAIRVETVRRILDCGIPVMGHIGCLPSWIGRYGTYRVQGKTLDAARAILQDALALEEAGVFAIVLEVVPPSLARIITERVSVPTIGIEAGPHTDGQVLVTPDMLGWDTGRSTRYVRQYESLGDRVAKAVGQYIEDVEQGSFPDESSSYSDGNVDWSQL